MLAPYNYVQMQDPRYAETFEALAAVCAERRVALQTIKSLARRRWDGRAAHRGDLVRAAARAGGRRPRRRTGCSGGRRRFLLTTGDVEILPRLLDAAERFESRPSDEQMRDLAARAEAEPLFV